MERLDKASFKIVLFRSWRRKVWVDEKYEIREGYLGNEDQHHPLPRGWGREGLPSVLVNYQGNLHIRYDWEESYVCLF